MVPTNHSLGHRWWASPLCLDPAWPIGGALQAHPGLGHRLAHCGRSPGRGPLRAGFCSPTRASHICCGHFDLQRPHPKPSSTVGKKQTLRGTATK